MNENAQSSMMKGENEDAGVRRRRLTSRGGGDVEMRSRSGGLLESATRRRLSVSDASN